MPLADLVEDGATLQIGIGTIPEAVLKGLTEKHDLGIHSEMLSDGMIPLIEHGVVNCRRKTLHRGKAVVSFVMGTRKLYDFVADHPLMEFHPCDYTNDPFVIAQNDRMVAINTALEVDLTGQVCADSIGAQFYSGIGGQVDFIRGAARSRGGRPIIALPSTALDGSASRIVPHLSEGAGVVTTRGDVHYVVTEYGVAQLHGKTVRERALALIHIAHPNFRPWLLAEAKRHNFIYRERKDVPVKVSLYPDRFEKHYRLKSGAAVFVRPVKPTDENKVNDLFYGLSEDSVYQRFFATCRFFSRSQIQDLCSPDYDRDMAIVVCIPTEESEDEQIVGMGVYSLNPATGFADVSFLVAEAMQGQGVGSLLMGHILKVARRQGVHGFTADVLANNSRMLHIFHKCGFPIETSLADGIYQVRIPFEESGAKQAADEVAAADQPSKPPSSGNTRSAPASPAEGHVSNLGG